MKDQHRDKKAALPQTKTFKINSNYIFFPLHLPSIGTPYTEDMLKLAWLNACWFSSVWAKWSQTITKFPLLLSYHGYIPSLLFDIYPRPSIFARTRSRRRLPSCRHSQSFPFYSSEWDGAMTEDTREQPSSSFTDHHAPLLDINYWLNDAADQTDLIHHNNVGVSYRSEDR